MICEVNARTGSIASRRQGCEELRFATLSLSSTLPASSHVVVFHPPGVGPAERDFESHHKSNFICPLFSLPCRHPHADRSALRVKLESGRMLARAILPNTVATRNSFQVPRAC